MVTGSLARRRVRRAAMLTDGASCLADQYGDCSGRELLDLLAGHGPHAAIERVRAVNAADPSASR